MSRREDIDNAIWTDPEFEVLSPNATLLYLWSFTNPRCGMAGLYKVSYRAMTESKVPFEDLGEALKELAEAGFAFYQDSVLWVRTRVKYLRSRSPQMARSIAKDLEKFPDGHPLRTRFLEMYALQPWLREQLAILNSEFPSQYISPKLRNAVLERDGHACVDCGSTENLTMDHVTPRSHAGPSTIGNLATRCQSCNSRKGVRPNKYGKSREGIHPIHPMEPIQVPGQWQGQGSSSGRERVELPEDFPRELRPHLRSAFKVLGALAERHNAKAVSPLSLATVVMARPRKPLVRAAYDCSAHWDGRSQPLRDVVAAYRNWLDRTDDLAGFEVLGDDGMPGSNGSNGTPHLSTRAERQARRLSALHKTANEGGAA